MVCGFDDPLSSYRPHALGRWQFLTAVSLRTRYGANHAGYYEPWTEITRREELVGRRGRHAGSASPRFAKG
jgi:hypothetical protein